MEFSLAWGEPNIPGCGIHANYHPQGRNPRAHWHTIQVLSTKIRLWNGCLDVGLPESQLHQDQHGIDRNFARSQRNFSPTHPLYSWPTTSIILHAAIGLSLHSHSASIGPHEYSFDFRCYSTTSQHFTPLSGEVLANSYSSCQSLRILALVSILFMLGSPIRGLGKIRSLTNGMYLCGWCSKTTRGSHSRACNWMALFSAN